jgi:hypothetical protein
MTLPIVDGNGDLTNMATTLLGGAHYARPIASDESGSYVNIARQETLLQIFGAIATASNQATAADILSQILSTLGSILTAQGGEATAANQTTANTALAALGTKLDTIHGDFAGKATTAKQDAILTALATLHDDLATVAGGFTGQATAANQSTLHTDLVGIGSTATSILSAFTPLATSAGQTTLGGKVDAVKASVDALGALFATLATGAKQDALQASVGDITDTSYTTGSGSVISLLKGVYAKLGAVVIGAGSAIIGRVILSHSAADVSTSNPLPVAGPATDAELRATPLPVAISGGIDLGDITVSSDGLTDTQLRAAPVPVSGEWATLGDLEDAVLTVQFATPQAVTGTVGVSGTVAATGDWLTDDQLRAAVIPVAVDFPATQAVTGPLTNTELRATPVPVSGALTDTQLRATAVPVSVGGSVAVTGTFWQATQPVSIAATVAISASSLPLPTDAATETKQNAANLKLDGILAALGNPLAVTGTFWQATQPVSVSALPLPTGAATAAKQDTGNTSLAAIDAKLGATLAVTGGLTDTQLRATPVPVSGTFWQATQPVSGTFWQTTQPVSIAATVAVSGPLTDTQLRATAVPVSGAFFPATQPVSIAATVAVSGPLTDTQLRATAVPVSGTFWQATQPVSGPLTDTQLRATAVPVSGTVVTGGLTDTQLRATAVPVSGSFFPATQPVSIAASVAVTGPLTDTQLRATAVPVSGTVAVTGTFWQATQPVSIAATVPVSGPLTDTQLRATALPVSGTFFQATQPVSIAATVAVSGPLTDTQLRATAVPISAASLPLPSGAATSALQTSGNSSLTSIDGKLPATLGQKLSAASLSVVISSDQSALPISSSPAASDFFIGFTPTQYFRGSATFTRPANTTGYTAGDYIGPTVAASSQFSMLRAGSNRSSRIKRIGLQVNNVAQASKLLGVGIFNAAVTLTGADNDPLTGLLSSTNVPDLVAVIPLTAMPYLSYFYAAQSLYSSDENLDILITSSTVSFVLFTAEAFTPSSGAAFTFFVDYEQN